MIPFNLTALTRPTPLIQRKAKTREISQTSIQPSFVVLNFNETSYSNSKIFSSTTALRHFRKNAMAEMNSEFSIDED